MKFQKLTVKEVTFRLKDLLYENKIHYRTTRVSSYGSRYLKIYYEQYTETIRIADHHENNRRLPRYNVLVGYDIQPETLSRTARRYYNEHHLLELIEHIKKDAGKEYEEFIDLVRPRDRVSQIERYSRLKRASTKPKNKSRRKNKARRKGVW